ncbi:MAG: hypothetical protein H0X39_00085 [Actinobacteria bacterium]|nr:hypothetical protein [Actinomycetota bacterium]
MSIQELIRDYEFSPNVRNEMFIAYDENPKGFERVATRATNANNPPAALTSMIRQGAHLKDAERSKGTKPAADTLNDLATIAAHAYRARITKYPPIDERGWTHDDAIAYGVWVASTWSNRVAQDDIERAMRILINKPWDVESDPALGTGCPPELLARIQRGISRIGIVEAKPVAAPPAADTLAQRLLDTLGEKAA